MYTKIIFLIFTEKQFKSRATKALSFKTSEKLNNSLPTQPDGIMFLATKPVTTKKLD